MLLPLLRPPRLSTIITRVVLRRQYSACLSELFPRSFHIRASMPPRRSARTALQPSSTNLAPLATSPRNLEQMPAPFPPSKPPRETLLAVALSMDEDNVTPPPASDAENEQVGKALDGAAVRVLTKRKRSSKLIVEEEGMENEEVSSTKGKKRGRKARDELSTAKKEAEREEELDVKERLTTPANGKKSGRKTKVESAVTAENEEQEKKPKKKAVKKSRIAENEPQYDEEGNEIVTRNRKPRVYPKKIYEIPDVERKTTTFRGRCFVPWLSDCSVLIIYRAPWIRLFEHRVASQQAQ